MDMLSFQLTRNQEKPLYEQLYQQIRNEIIAGRLAYGTKLPSKRKLGQFLNLSQTTIELAYQQLVAEGYVESISRKGYFILAYEELAYVKTSPVIEPRVTKDKPVITYDFHPSKIEGISFPFARWRKYAKDIIDTDHHPLVSLGHPQGDLALREEIATYLYHSRGVVCSPEQIVVGSGVEQLLPLVLFLLGRDVTYGIEDPGYHTTRLLLENHERMIEPIRVDANGLRIDHLQESNVDVMYVTPAHQFPSGSILSVNRRHQLLNWAAMDPTRFIIEDDYDSEFRYSGKSIPSLHNMDSNRVIYMSTFSKSLMPSLRIGYMVLPEVLRARYQTELSHYTCSVSRFDQTILTRFMKEGDFERHLNRMRKVYRRKLDVLIQSLRRIPALRLTGESAGLHVVVSVANGMTEQELVKRAQQQGIQVYGLSQYAQLPLLSVTPQIVLGFASLSEQALTEGLRLLMEAWDLHKSS